MKRMNVQSFMLIVLVLLVALLMFGQARAGAVHGAGIFAEKSLARADCKFPESGAA